MPFTVDIDTAKKEYPEYIFIKSLTPSEQKCAFHVQDKRTKQNLCFKIISPHYGADRLQREIQALQAISHPNIVKLIAYVFVSKKDQQKHYLIEEFIEGEDLSVLLQPGHPMQVEAAAKLFAEICDGLAAMAVAQLVHRDLKPSNIRINKEGKPVIIDFGLVRALDMESLTRTSHGAQIGTPTYFSPEQIKGSKHDIDHRTDLFATGILLYQAVTGYHPFRKPEMQNRGEVLDAICESEEYLKTSEFNNLNKSIRILLTKTLSKERCGRPQSAEHIALILRKVAGTNA